MYYIHNPDGKAPIGDAVGELVRMKEEGEICAIGISNMSLEQVKEANTHGDINALQLEYSMLNRSVEKNLLPYCVENNISFVPFGPLAFGLLGGKRLEQIHDTVRAIAVILNEEDLKKLTKFYFEIKHIGNGFVFLQLFKNNKTITCVI